jgi:hypothetical protein
MMNLLKKAAISLAATSMIAAPVAASAAPAARAASAVDGQSELEGSTSWILALLALAAVVGGSLLLVVVLLQPAVSNAVLSRLAILFRFLVWVLKILLLPSRVWKCSVRFSIEVKLAIT